VISSLSMDVLQDSINTVHSDIQQANVREI
jgi:hypothetical protein